MKIVTLTKKNKILKGEINLPASKSISNRALILNHLSKNQLALLNISRADDSKLMSHLLEIISTSEKSDPVELNCENAGTVIRFLTAVLANTSGNWILTGNSRMKERPIGILVEALVQLGAKITYLEKDGFPPLQINGNNLSGGYLKIDGSVSSQFISALLLIAPTLENGLHLILTNKISSKPYIEMTLGLLRYFGISYSLNGNDIRIEHQKFKAKELKIEPDWSSAAYWYEMVAFADVADILLKDLIPGNLSNLTLKLGLTDHRFSLQGDSILPEIYQSFGVKTECLEHGIRLTKSGNQVKMFEFDFSNNPDLAQSVIITCTALGINGIFSGLESLRIKETDRLNALQTELLELGFKTELVQRSKPKCRTGRFEVQSWDPNLIKNNNLKKVNTYGDHRMAMAFAPLSLIYDNIKIENPDVVSKSYPDFWRDLNSVGILTSFNK